MAAARYRATQKARDHYSVLGDPTHLTAEQRAAAERLLCRMRDRDLALQRICARMEDPTGTTLSRVQSTCRQELTARNAEVYRLVIERGQELVQELLQSGFIERV